MEETKKPRTKWPPLTPWQLEEIKRLRSQGIPRKKVATQVNCAEHQVKLLEWKEQGHMPWRKQQKEIPSDTPVKEIPTEIKPSAPKKKRGGYTRYSAQTIKSWADGVALRRMDDVTASLQDLAIQEGVPKSQLKKVIAVASEVYKQEIKSAVKETEYVKVEVPTETTLAESLPSVTTDVLVLEVLHRVANMLTQCNVPLASSFKAALKPLPDQTIKLKENEQVRKRVLLVGFLDGQAKILRDEFPDLDIRFVSKKQPVPDCSVGWVIVAKFVSHSTWNQAKASSDRKVYYVQGLSDARRRLGEIRIWKSQV